MQLKIIRTEAFNNVNCEFYRDEYKNVFMTSEQLGEVLEYARPRESINKLVSRNPHIKDEDFSCEVYMTSIDSKNREMRLFTEDGIYEVTMLSSQPKAIEFRSWVRSVLKSIRKGEQPITPQFKVPQTLPDALRLAADLAEENLVMKPKAEGYDRMIDATNLHPMSEIAKLLNVENFGRNKLFKFLRDQGILRRNNEPYQEYLDKELFKVKSNSIKVSKKDNEELPDPILKNISQTFVTAKGIDYIHRKLRECSII